MNPQAERLVMAATAGIDTSVFTEREAERLDPIMIGGIITIAVNLLGECQKRKNPDPATAYDNAQASYDDAPVQSRNQVKHMVMKAGHQKGINLSGRTAREFADNIIGQGLQLNQAEVVEMCTAV